MSKGRRAEGMVLFSARARRWAIARTAFCDAADVSARGRRASSSAQKTSRQNQHAYG
jgi:hypothetical protein